jgi:hypothetical protein
MSYHKSAIATRPRLEQFRALLRDTTDPFEIRLIQEIVAELESRLAKRQLLNSSLEETGQQGS